MVEESTDSPLVLEGNELESSSISRIFLEESAFPINDVNPRRASTGSCHDGGKPALTIEKSKSAKIRQNVVPIYHRKRTSSCHDLCKLGRGHSSEEKAKPVARRKRTGKTLPNVLIPVQIMVPDGKREEGKVVNHKPSRANPRHSLDLELSADVKSYSPKQKTPLEKAKVVKIKTSTDAKNHSRNSHSHDFKPIHQKIRPSTSSPGQSISHLTRSKSLPVKKLPSPDPPEIIKSVCFPSEKVEVPGKKGFSAANKLLKSAKEAVVPLKQQISSLRVSPVKVKPAFSSEKLDVKQGKEKNPAALKATPKKVLSPKHSVVKIAQIKSRKDGGLMKLVSPQKDKNRVRRVKTNPSSEEKVSEKTLHVINIETANNVPESIPDDHPTSSFPSDEKSSSLESNEADEVIELSDIEADEFISDHDSVEIISITPVEENDSKTPRKSRTILSEDGLGPPLKLKFKTGKVVDLKLDNHSPRKLRFRRARVHGGEDNTSAFGRTLKKGGASDSVASSTSTSSVKIVLKHQNVNNKKDAQGLFNNVIEETASKLVESRKSKVKALVGAFETVISLQECKPSTSPVAGESYE